MGQAIIKVFKGCYQTEVVRKLLYCTKERREVRASINVYETMFTIHKVLNNVTSAIMKNYFKKAGFEKKKTDEENVVEEEGNSIHTYTG